MYKDLDGGTTLNSLGNFVSPRGLLPWGHTGTMLPSGHLDVKTQSEDKDWGRDLTGEAFCRVSPI